MRAEMGYPIIVTPVSQFIASQAARNVIDGERWKTVSDETVRYFLGHYGEPPAPVDPEIADRVPRAPQAAQAARPRADQPRGRARERFGERISEEELLLRLTMPAEQVDAMVAQPRPSGADAGRARPGAQPARRAARRGSSPIVTLLQRARPAATSRVQLPRAMTAWSGAVTLRA